MDCVISGLGAVACVGSTVHDIYDALCAGRSGLTPLRAFDHDLYRTTVAYEIDDRPGHDVAARASHWLLDAIGQAVDDARLEQDLATVPVIVGTTLREQRSVELWWREQAELGPADLHFGPALRTRFGTRRTYTVANACAASLCALAMGADMIENGEADTVVVAGTDAITESAFGALDRVQNVPPDRLRPFDRDRRGMIMGEGAVAAVLQAGGGARGHHARLRGVAMNCDADHPTAPGASSIGKVVRQAHLRADVDATDVDLVMLHGSGTDRNDAVEAEVLSEVFERRSSAPTATAIKSMTGHTLGGSGLLSLAVATQVFRHHRVPPVLGLENPIDAAHGLDLVSGEAAVVDARCAQIDAFGFGGINAVAVITP